MAEIGVVVKDPEGNEIERIPYGTNKQADNAYTQQATTGGEASKVYFYDDEAGNRQYTFDGNEIPTRVSLDEESGRIKLQAPPMAMRNESFKNSISKTLTNLSANYKADPNYKYNISDENGDNQAKSIQDIIADMNGPAEKDGMPNSSSLDGMAKSAIQIEMQKDAHKNGNGVDLSDDEIVMSNTYAAGEDVKDDSLVMISDLKEADFLKEKVSTYDSSTGAAQYKDIMDNAWNRDKTSDEDMQNLVYALRDYFERGDFSDTTAYAKNVATWRFINAHTPEASWIKEAGAVIESVLNGIENFLGDVGTGIGVIASDLGYNLYVKPLARLVGGDDFVDVIEEQAKNKNLSVAGGTNLFSDFIGDDTFGYEKVDSYLGDVVMGEDGVPIYKKDAIKISGSYEDGESMGIFQATRALFKEKQAIMRRDWKYLSETKSTAEQISYMIAETAAMISAGNVLSAGVKAGLSTLATKAATTAGKLVEVGEASSKAAEMANLMSRGSFLGVAFEDVTVIRGITNGMGMMFDFSSIAGKTATLLNGVSKLASASPTVGFASLVSESLAEAVVGDTDRLVTLVKSKDVTNDDKTYLMQTFVGNALGWGVGITAAKGLTKASKTTIGGAVSYNVSRQMFKMQNTVGASLDNVMLKIRRVGGDKLADRIVSLYDRGTDKAVKQANSLTANAMLREVRDAIAEGGPIKMVGKSKDEIQNAVSEARAKIIELEGFENAVTTAQKRGVDLVSGWLKDDKFGMKEAAENFYSKAGKLADLEKSAGKSFKHAEGAVQNLTKNKTMHLFSQRTTNFVKATSKKKYDERYIEMVENAKKNGRVTQKMLDTAKAYQEKELPDLDKMIKDFTDNATPELQQAALEFVDADQKFWRSYMDLAKEYGILENADEIDAMRKSGLWGENGTEYARTSRKQEMNEYTFAHRNGQGNRQNFEKDYSYAPGATGDFTDPMAEMQIALQQAGEKYAYQNLLRSYNNITGSLHLEVSAGEQKLVDALSTSVQKNYQKTSKQLFSGLSEQASLHIDDMSDALTKRLEAKIGVGKTNKAIKTATESLDESVQTVSAKNAPRYIYRLDQQQTDDVWGWVYGEESIEDVLSHGEETQKLGDFAKNAQKEREKFPRNKKRTGNELMFAFEKPLTNIVEGDTTPKVPRNVVSLIKKQADGFDISYTDDTSIVELYRKVKNVENFDVSNINKNSALDLKIKQSFLSQNVKIKEDPDVLAYLSKIKQDRWETRQLEFIYEREDELAELTEALNISEKELAGIMDGVADDFVDVMLANGTQQRDVIEKLCEFYGLEGNEEAMRYFALRTWSESRTSFGDKLKEKIAGFVKSDSKKETHRITKALSENIDKYMESELDDARLIVRELNPAATADEDKRLFAEVNELSRKIKGVKSRQFNIVEQDGQMVGKDVVALVNPKGGVDYFSTSPLIAHLVNFTQGTAPQRGALWRAIYNTNYLWTKLFRLGTTAINIKSMIMQTFRDPLNMWITSGGNNTIKQCAASMEDVIGADLNRYIQQLDPEVFAKIQRTSEETGESVEKLIVERELTMGRAISPASTETAMYGSLNSARKARIANPKEDIYDVTFMDRTIAAMDKIGDTLGKPNQKRESYLRNLAYANGFNDALKKGYSIDQARIHATFVMNESTTNFARLTGHFTTLRDSVPYLGAAINGSKSFYRMLSIDPVGVAGRLVGGIIIPIMALTAYSLSDEENRKVYKNIKEYNKEDNFVFVVNGQAFSIPLPQEIGAFIAPFRQIVEGIHGANDNTFPQLFWHDILGFSPIELQGFADLDFSKIESSSPGFTERIGSGVSRAWAQLAPAPLKSALELVTGIDPYTGKKIDTSYPDIDEDGNPIIRDYRSGKLATAIHDMFGSWGKEVSAPVIQNTLTNIFGDASVDILDFIASLAEAVPAGGLQWSMDTEALEKNEAYNPFYTLSKRVSAPVEVSVYDEAQSAWKAAVTKAYDMKEEILESDEWKKYIAAKDQTTDPDKLKNLNATKKNLVSDYFDYVKNMVTNLQQNYGEQFTAAKFATVLSLMTMEEQTLDAGAHGDYLNSETFKTARAQAIQSMINLGFESDTTSDMLGHYRVDSKGNYTIKYNHPLSILQLDDTSGGGIAANSKKQHFATINKIINNNGLYDRRQRFYDENREATNNKDWDKAEELANEYNAEVLSVIDPYIQQYGAKSVLQGDTLDLVADFIYPPSNDTVMGRAKYLSSSKTGVGFNKHDAFAENYLKTIYGLKEMP